MTIAASLDAMRKSCRVLPAIIFGAWAGGAAAQSPLATPEQAALERQAIRVFASPTVQDQLAAVEQALSADPYAKTPEGHATLAAAAREIVFAAVQDSINRDPARPRLQWLWAPPHRWFGIDVPASKVLMPNVDNVFRIVPVDATSHYRLIGRPAGPVPTQFTVQLLPALPGEARWSRVQQEVIDSEISKAADGSFVLNIGPEAPAAGNHIMTTPEARFLLIRDTIEDWHRETPYRLTIARLDKPPSAPETTEAELVQESAARVTEIVPRIQQAKGGGFANAPGFFAGPPNHLTAPKTREGGRWGLSSSGHFKIAADEAVAITLDPIGAKYLAIQLASGWLSSIDSLHHTATLNLAQVRRNADGTVTFVIAARNPGVANWLDTAGLHEGSIFVRWQKLPKQTAPEASGVRSVRLVKLSNLAGLPHVTDAEQRVQLAQRIADYSRRSAER